MAPAPELVVPGALATAGDVWAGPTTLRVRVKGGRIVTMNGSGRVRLLVADPLYGDRLLAELAVADDPNVELVGVASDGMVAARLADEHQPDAIIVDPGMRMPDGTDAVSLLRVVCPHARLVAWVNEQQPDALAIAAGGVSVVVSKSRSTADLLAAVRQAETAT